MKKIAIFGAGGFGREIACLINSINKLNNTWEFIGFFDDGLEIGTTNKYGKVLGGINELNSFSEELNIVIAIANPSILKKIYDSITNSLIEFTNLVAPNVNFFDEETLTIGKGNLLFWGCRISLDCVIGDFNLFNGFVSLGHDVTLGSYNVLNPSVRISGDCNIGDENFFGVQSVVLQGNKIGTKTRIGANSVIMRKTQDGQLYIGNPAKKITI
jgi:sugar O-acyltransferase (sialic acid O-acetyltransferase NeuD family)